MVMKITHRCSAAVGPRCEDGNPGSGATAHQENEGEQGRGAAKFQETLRSCRECGTSGDRSADWRDSPVPERGQTLRVIRPIIPFRRGRLYRENSCPPAHPAELICPRAYVFARRAEPRSRAATIWPRSTLRPPAVSTPDLRRFPAPRFTRSVKVVFSLADCWPDVTAS